MAIETERKFLVAGPFAQAAIRADRIAQGYLSSVPERTVRIRLGAEQAFLTVKGMADGKGFSRREFEYEIPVADAEAMLALCEPGVIDKTRHLVPFAGHTWEVDVFHGRNEGLCVAEVELKSETESFERPAWLAEEVTGLARYYNSALSKHPYEAWTEDEQHNKEIKKR